MDAKQVLKFWFEELKAEDRFAKNAAVDARIADLFTEAHAAASRGELWTWRDSADGRLAEIIILDQFSRNLFRESPRAFAQDGMALVLAQWAIAEEAPVSLSPEKRSFLYMPFMHSESARIHEVAESLFSEPGLEYGLKYEIMHKRIIDRFGRYPHRNKVLGRKSTPEEEAFLKEPNSGF